MNEDAKFEDRLRRQSLKPIPAEWREDILRHAARSCEVRSAAVVRPPSLFEALRSRLAVLLWPAPRAWAGLATVWAAILVMNLSGGRESTTPAMATALPVAQTRQTLKQRQLLLAELAGYSEAREAVQPRGTSPGPRSQRCVETTIV